MPSQNFTSTFTVAQPPADVFRAINNVGAWWTGEIEGDAHRVGDRFSYRYPGAHYSQQEVAQLVADKKVIWHVIDADLEGPGNRSDWTGTDITFEIVLSEAGTEVRFSHIGLVPDLGCFDRCSSGWGFFVNVSLKRLITTGEGPTQPPWARKHGSGLP